MADDGMKGIPGSRHRVTYRKENLYINIFPSKCEIFISSVDEDPDLLTRANYNALSRLCTLAWKKSSLDEVVKQLRRSSEVTWDLPGIIANLLMEDDFEK